MSAGYDELEAESNEKQSVPKVSRKSISLKLKREPQDEQSHPVVESPEPEMRDEPINQAETLNWNFKVKLSAEKKSNKENLLNFCEKCKRPILVHGRLIPCKHFLCLNCAQKGTRNCFKCDTPIKGIQPVPKIYVCAHEGTRHSLHGCRKSYLNFMGLDQHQKLRHSGDEVSAEAANLDSDGELSVNKPPTAAASMPPVSVQASQPLSVSAAPPVPPQFSMSMPPTAALQPPTGALHQPVSMPPGAVMSGPPSVVGLPGQPRPVMFNQQPPAVAVPTGLPSNTRLTFATPTPRPTAVLIFPRPQLTVTSMTPLLVPPRGLGAPQMMNLPGMLPQPAAMMPLPSRPFQAVPISQQGPLHTESGPPIMPQGAPPVIMSQPGQVAMTQQPPISQHNISTPPPGIMTQPMSPRPPQGQMPPRGPVPPHVPMPPQGPMPQKIPMPSHEQDGHAIQSNPSGISHPMPIPGQMPMPLGQMPPSMPATTQIHIMQQPSPGLPNQGAADRNPIPPSVPESLRENGGRGPMTPPPPGGEFTPPSLDQMNYSQSDTPPPPPPRVMRPMDPREQHKEVGTNEYRTNYEQDPGPRDPRKARDIPPPPPPRNGTVR